MPTAPLILHHSPNACSQAADCALEQSGLEYRMELVDLAAGAPSTPAYLAVSPLGRCRRWRRRVRW